MRSDGDARINNDGEIRCDDSSDEVVTSRERGLSATFLPAGAVDRRIMRAPGMAAEIVHGIAHGHILTHVHGPRHTLIAYHRGLRRSRDAFIAGASHASTNHFAHKLVLVPAGHQYRCWHEIGTDLLALVFYLDPEKVRVSSGKMAAEGTLALRLFFEDARLWATVVKMKELIDSAADDQQYFEALGLVLIHEIYASNRGRWSAEALPADSGGLWPNTWTNIYRSRSRSRPWQVSFTSAPIISVVPSRSHSACRLIVTSSIAVSTGPSSSWRKAIGQLATSP